MPDDKQEEDEEEEYSLLNHTDVDGLPEVPLYNMETCKSLLLDKLNW